MRTLIRFFVENNKLTWVIMLTTIIGGIQGLNSVRREQNPTVNLGMAQVVTIYPGATAEEVEVEVTKKIEDEIKEVSGLKDVKSVSQNSQSIIRIRIDIDNYDQSKVMEELQRAVNRVSGLPSGIYEDPEFTEIKTEEFAVLELAIFGPNDLRQRDAFAENIADELEDVKGVLEVEEVGLAEREYSVKLNADKLHQMYVSMDEVLDALRTRNVSIPAGNLESYDNQAIVKLDAKARTIYELENVLIRSNFDGKKVYLKDVATVEDSKEKIEFFTKINGRECTVLEVKKRGGVDTIRLVNSIMERLKMVEDSFNRDGEFEILPYYNEADEVQAKFDIIVSNVLSGGVIILFFLLIFLPGKVGIVSTLSLPFCVLITLAMMPIMGINLNAISMLAIVIALGMLVDNSIVVSENYSRLRLSGMTSKEAAIEGTAELAMPVMATAFTTIAAFVPMFMTKGVMGLFIAAIPTIVTMTLLISILEAFFLLPTRLELAGRTMMQKKKRKKVKDRDWFDRMTGGFEKFMYTCVRHRYIVAMVFVGLMVMTVVFFKLNKFILFPAEDVRRYVVTYEGNLGDSLEKLSSLSDRLTADIQNVLGEDSEYVISYVGRSGAQSFLTDIQQNHHVGEMIVQVNKLASYRLNHNEVLEKFRAMDTSYLKSVTFETEGNGPPVGKPVEAVFRSNNSEKLDEVIGLMLEKVGSVPGIIDIETDNYKNDDEILVVPDYEKIARLGLTSAGIGNTVRASLEGIPVSNLTINNKEFDIKVRFDDSFKESQEDLRRIMVSDNRDNLIPLNSVAEIKRVPGSEMIHRYDFKKSINIKANVEESLITAIEANAKVAEFYSEIAADYPEVSMVFVGEQESTQESFESLQIAMKFAILAIFGVLVLMFSSYAKPFIIMSTIPLGFVGFVVAFYLHGRPISFLALIGVVGLAGMIVNAGIILIDFIDNMRKNSTMTLDEILAKSASMRLRAVSASTITTVAGLFPTAYGLGGRDASLMPLTLAMAWGMTVGTIFSIIWVPCAYGILEDMTRLVRRSRVGVYFYKRRLRQEKQNKKLKSGEYYS